jgi:hypothetical protein
VSGATYSTEKPYPPRSEWVPRIFYRAEGFYIVEMAEDDDVAEHVALNPGTLRVEDAGGEQLWPPKPEAVQ